MMHYSFLVDEENSNGEALKDADPLPTREISLVVESEDLVLELLGLETKLHAEDRQEKR